MPRPLTDRQRWQEELAELAQKIAKHRENLAALPAHDRAWHEFHNWLAREAEKRMAVVRERFANQDQTLRARE